MINIDKVWFIVQLVNFLVLIIILNYLLYRPMLRLFDQRKESTEGAIEEAKRLEEKTKEQLALYNKELSEARDRAKEIYNSLRQEGLQQQKALIEQAHEEAMREINEAREALKKESEKVRSQLAEQVRQFADEIVNKMVSV